MVTVMVPGGGAGGVAGVDDAGAAGDGNGGGVVLRPVAEVGAELAGLAAGIAAATCRFLVLLAEFDERDGWQEVGITSCAHWLSWRCGMSIGTAREHVRIARVLRDLPLTREAFGAGRLSYSKVRAITRVATAGTEAELVAVAASATANQLDRFVAAVRRVESLDEVNARHARRFLRYRQEADGCYTLTVRLCPEDAAVVIERLETGRDHLARTATGPSTDPAPEEFEQVPISGGRALADALVLVCAESTVGDSDAGTGVGLGSRRSESVLHATLEDLTRAGARTPITDPEPAGHTPAGTPATAPDGGARLELDAPAGAPTVTDAPAGAETTGRDGGTTLERDTPAGTPTTVTDVPAGTPASVPGVPPGEWEVVSGGGHAFDPQDPAWRLVTTATTPSEEVEVWLKTPAETAPAPAGAPAGRTSSAFGGRPATSHLIGPHLELGPALHPETARRLTCQTGLVLHLHADTGGPAFTVTPNARPGQSLDLGRRTRTPHAALLRALWDRDHGCRYPGCERRRYLHAHHITHWADGGPTTLDNLVLLCGQHHRLLHEGAYDITLRPDTTAMITDPDGHPVPHAPDSHDQPALPGTPTKNHTTGTGMDVAGVEVARAADAPLLDAAAPQQRAASQIVADIAQLWQRTDPDDPSSTRDNHHPLTPVNGGRLHLGEVISDTFQVWHQHRELANHHHDDDSDHDAAA